MSVCASRPRRAPRRQAYPSAIRDRKRAEPRIAHFAILSFLRALHIIQHERIWAAGMSPGKLPAHLMRMRQRLQLAIIEKRRGRKCPRVVKAKPRRYPARHIKEP
ncbi:MAG: family transposase [Proteobacteria bacterium]|nr:family transposase [Pseudomonadota bacterium]